MGGSAKAPQPSYDELAAKEKAAADAARVKAEEEALLARDRWATSMGLRGDRALFSSAGQVGFKLGGV